MQQNASFSHKNGENFWGKAEPQVGREGLLSPHLTFTFLP